MPFCYSILLSFFCFHWLYHLFSFAVNHCHLLSLVFICCHSFLFVVTRRTIHCHLLYNSLSFIVTCCHLFSLVVQLFSTRCNSLSLDTPLALSASTFLQMIFYHGCIKLNILWLPLLHHLLFKATLCVFTVYTTCFSFSNNICSLYVVLPLKKLAL